jgi:hypothetical protein
MAEEFGQHRRSGYSIIPIAKSCFPIEAGGGTAKTDDANAGFKML